MTGIVSRMLNFWLNVAAFFLGNALWFATLPWMVTMRMMNFWRRMLFGYTGGDRVNPVNKVVLVTGCDSGIGQATVIRLLQQGFTVMAGCLDAKAAQAQSATKFAEFKSSANLHIIQLDLRKQDQIDAAAKYVNDFLDQNPSYRFWSIVNNASIHAFGPFELLSIDTFRDMFDVNVLGMARVTKAFLPLMRRGGRREGGRVVNVGCIGGVEVPIPMLAYNGATKAAAVALSHVMESELAPRFGIRSVTVSPDDTYRTEMFNPDRLIQNFNQEVQKAKPEVIDAYGGQERMERMRQLIGKALPRLASNDPKPVVDAIIEGVSSPNPDAVYYPIEWNSRIMKAVYMASPDFFKRMIIETLPQMVPTWMLPPSSGAALMAGQWNVPLSQMPGIRSTTMKENVMNMMPNVSNMMPTVSAK